MKPKAIVVTGATCVGKSSLVYKLPKETNIEIICADSRQVYQHMNIGTAQPSDAEKKIFPHHGFSILQPNQKFSAGDFVKLTKQYMKEISSRGNIPLILGGTFFYIKALWDGLVEEPTANEETYNKVEALELSLVRKQLCQVDKTSFERIDQYNLQRNRRALYVSLVAGRPFSELNKEGGCFSEMNFYSFCVSRPRDLLYQRINTRTSKMFELGLILEINQLLKLGFHLNDPGLNAIGYKDIYNLIGTPLLRYIVISILSFLT